MTIKQLLDMPIGQETSGSFVLQVIHCHKMTEHQYAMPEYPKEIAGRSYWQHEVTLTDGIDEMKADVILKKKRQFCRSEELRIKSCEIIAESSGGYGKKLLIHEHERITYTPDQLEEPRVIEQQGTNNKWDRIARGKVKTHLLGSFLEGFGRWPTDEDRKKLIAYANWSMSQEDKYDG